MTDEEREIEETLKMMHMLARIFAITKDEPVYEMQNEPAPIPADNSPKPEPKAPRFTALKAKLEQHVKESTPAEADSGISEG